jgi:predicted nuclease of restriction endonuclease-like (RecB) superfamily
LTNETKKLLQEVREIILSARTIAVRGVNTLQVLTNYEIGRLIVEYEQLGESRAEYGKRLLKDLSKELTVEFGRGFSLTNLKLMRQFYLMKKNLISPITSESSTELQKGQTPSDQLPSFSEILIKQQSSRPFTLSWSHYVFLMTINDTDERSFYEIEATNNNWTLRELKRQFNSGVYERLALSRDKDKVKELSTKGQIIERPEDMLKEPYVLEFLGLDEKAAYSERDVESAIIDKLEHFLLELGKGFLFEARQKRFTFDSDHFYVDLVFYNRILRCYVLIDLKLDKLTHQDLGQMQMYVNYFDRHVRMKGETPTIGVILCKTKNDALVELTLPKNTKVYPKQYQLYLPSKDVLKQKLLEWTGESKDRKDE